MTPEEAIMLAKAHGADELFLRENGDIVWMVDTQSLIRIVGESMKYEREKCAKLCDSEKERALLHRQDGAALGAEECANLIRARGSNESA